MNKIKIVKDLVHGYIDIDNNVSKIIDNSSFQRLKKISQLTAHHLYPSANHTRFEHSLGVMHLALKFFYRLKHYFPENYSDQLDFLKFHLKYAALLHDVGHAPFSHVGEFFYDKKEIESKLSEIFPEVDKDIFSKGSNHETMSCYIIHKNFKVNITTIAENEKITVDYNFLYKIITGSLYEENKERNLMINLINSNSIDVDKLDYLLRDNFMTGETAPRINIERLLKSICLDIDLELSFKPLGLSSLISLIDSRDFLYLWVYNHHTVVYTDFLYQNCLLHLMKSTEKKENLTVSLYKQQLFSCDAISSKLVSDDDVRVLFNEEFLTTKSQYSKTILPQLLERNFLKPLWKTISEFKNFMEYNFDDKEREFCLRVLANSNDKFRRRCVNFIRKDLNINPGELLVINRSNRFYNMEKSKFYLLYNNSTHKEINNVFPIRKWSEVFNTISFYIFCEYEKKDDVKKSFIKCIKERLL